VEIARKTYDREDEPTFEPSWKKHGDIVVVTLKMIDGPPEVSVGVAWTAVSVVPSGDGVYEPRPTGGSVRQTTDVVRGESIVIRAMTDPQADRGTITLDLSCQDAADESRTWRCPVVVDWQLPPPPRIY
jgi:hypothetical protein